MCTSETKQTKLLVAGLAAGMVNWFFPAVMDSKGTAQEGAGCSDGWKGSEVEVVDD